MDESPPHRVLAEFYDTERYQTVYDRYEELDAGWKEVLEAGVESLATDTAQTESTTH
ncbi:hypothetical protein [Halonotius aquaticus]|uniref:hypothetical protein n=1 Tax=Halonotius aquaticus TaxID=2216978 RepID=UPI001402514E|nr:hypothetical protein [Halonotius aquaticus]